MHLAHRADGAVPNPFAQQARGFRSLVADGNLRGYPGLPRNLGKPPCFVDGVRQRLLAENVFALFHGRSCNRGVQIVRRAHHHGIDVFLFF